MTPLQTNKPLFFDDDGDALEGGQIYVGQPATDPRTSPKTVTFRDSGGATFTAQQPLKTVAGRIVYNGKPIVTLVDGEYSLLILDSAGKQIDYSRSVLPSSSEGGGIAEFSETIRVGLTLSDIKALDVSVGDSVRNVGKITATDDLGADWLVVSATGNPADDVGLIDFTNGLQGNRQKSNVYRKDVLESGLFVFDDPEVIVNTTDADVYRNTWTTIDLSSVVPDNASSAIIRVSLLAAYSSAGIADSISSIISVRKTGQSSSPTLSSGTRIAAGNERTDTNDNLSINLAGEATVPLTFGASSEFDLYLVVNDPLSSSENTDPDLSVSVIGYTINAKDLV